MNAEVDDPGVYHQDFTTASGWEEFVDRVEKTIIDWKLNQTRIRNPIQKGDLGGAWVEKSEEIRFEGEKLYLSWWSLEDGVVVANEDTENTSASLPQSFTDMMSIAGDFVTVPTCPRVAQLFGIREFLLLHSDKKALVSSETKAKILLGSLTMAVNATGCEIPAFVQLLENWQHFYLGSCVGKDVSADYEMVHLERTPQHCKYLTGLLDTFKSKISRQQLPSINIAVRLTYSLRRLGQWFSVTELKDHDGSSSLMNLPFGMISDPISKLQLFATWPQLTDQMVVDSQSYSDLEPMQAHAWSVRIQLELNQDSLRLAQCLESLCKLASESPIPFIADFKKPKYGQSLDALTESKVPTISKVFDKVISANSANAGTHKKRQGVIPDSTLQEYLYFLFPDADRNSVSVPT
ncbi:hypothetical protein ONE63_004468 [Megalurothrips usitatus]|uniref:Rab3 GTPase-activating protein catalytic subunit n=1 Tax=Megalurothrips usitatus TaxID=439358 RepID=A0AAV7X6B2_9NEOP|nr:hypothetical protein ONE63_004468 [Megalurothrips usitatus]